MSNVISTYNIQFLTKSINGKYRKTMYSVNEVLNQFITDFKTPEEVNDFLLTPLNSVIGGASSSENLVTESMVSAQIASDTTGLFQDPDYDPTSTPDFSLPTQDLLGIAEAWLNYITITTVY